MEAGAVTFPLKARQSWFSASRADSREAIRLVLILLQSGRVFSLVKGWAVQLLPCLGPLAVRVTGDATSFDQSRTDTILLIFVRLSDSCFSYKFVFSGFWPFFGPIGSRCWPRKPKLRMPSGGQSMLKSIFGSPAMPEIASTAWWCLSRIHQ